MKKLLLILLLCIPFFIAAKEINIHNIIEFEISDEFEIFSISESLKNHRKSDQYNLRISVGIIYDNKYFNIRIDLFGYGENINELNRILNNEIGEYSSNYQTADQIKYLKENFQEHKELLRNEIPSSRFVSSWSTGWSYDYFGVYFEIDNEYFSDGIINTINIWNSFGGKNLRINDLEYNNKKSELTEEGQLFLQYFENFIQSISFSPKKKIMYNNSLIYKKSEKLPGYYIPTVENLRLRESPELNSPILGYVKEFPYHVIETGPLMTINGIENRWYRILASIGSEVGWAFGGYMREITNEEKAEYFEGI